MLEKHHNIVMFERTLKRRLNDYGCARRSDVDDDLRRRVRDLILLEIGNGPDSLNGYRTMWHVPCTKEPGTKNFKGSGSSRCGKKKAYVFETENVYFARS